jgi:hypothetical protein
LAQLELGRRFLHRQDFVPFGIDKCNHRAAAFVVIKTDHCLLGSLCLAAVCDVRLDGDRFISAFQEGLEFWMGASGR